jgi:5'-nucleotidase/UDP-sugar diphosphatase
MKPRNTTFTVLSALLLIAVLVSACSVPTPAPTSTATTAPSATSLPPTAIPASATPEPTAAATATATAVPTEEATNFELTILHTNDVHAHQAADADGNGGAALAASVIAQVRAANPNTLLLSAGDTYTGTLFQVVHHGLDSAELMNSTQYDAMTLGNHEFDEGDDVLAAFLQTIDFPAVAANVDFSASESLNGLAQPYVVLEKGGQQIGVIGLVNPETPSSSSPGKELVFSADTLQVVENAVTDLTAAGVNKIIVLSHLGYQADVELAVESQGVDVIVGGHTHTLLANYDTRAAGPYPAEITNAAGGTTLVVQAGEYQQYVGQLNVEFDPQGEPVNWSGDTIFLSHFITPDAGVSAEVEALAEPIAAMSAQVIGQSSIYLEGDRTVCRAAECNLGNLITDAMRAETGAQIAIENGGGIRASIQPGDVTLGDVLTVLPFGNLVSTFSLSGADVRAALENGVSQMESGGGRFPQVSGLRYTIDPAKPAGSRIVSVEVLDENGEYQPLDPAALYTVASNDFMRQGGDGYTMLAENAVDAYDYGRPLDQVVSDYIAAQSPVEIDLEGRITIQ